jgi:hypothetical protein
VAAGAVLLAELTGDSAQGEVVAGAHGGEAFDAVTLVPAGALYVGDGAHGRAFTTGEVMLWNSGQSGHLTASAGLRMLHLLMPRTLARQRWPALVVGTEARTHGEACWTRTLALAGASAGVLPCRAGRGHARCQRRRHRLALRPDRRCTLQPSVQAGLRRGAP